MSRLHQELQKRGHQERTVSDAEDDIRKRYEAKRASLEKLGKSKDFDVYLKIEEEMNNPMIVVAKDCTDPACMALKHKIRDFTKRKQLLERVSGRTRA